MRGGEKNKEETGSLDILLSENMASEDENKVLM